MVLPGAVGKASRRQALRACEIVLDQPRHHAQVDERALPARNRVDDLPDGSCVLVVGDHQRPGLMRSGSWASSRKVNM
jgi:hypothetical protein